MENATKALGIAIGVLIGVLILGLIMYTHKNISSYQSAIDKETELEQAIDFNKQFDVFDRDELLGSEIISLVNKIEDYNNGEESRKGYEKITVKIELKETSTHFTTKNENGSTFIQNYTNLLNAIKANNRMFTISGNRKYTAQQINNMAHVYKDEIVDALNSDDKRRYEEYVDCINEQKVLLRATFDRKSDFAYYSNGRLKTMEFMQTE